MTLFEEPSRQPLPRPNFEDVQHAGGKALVAMIPFVGGAGSELIGLLTSPVAERRDAWLEDLQRRLQELEGRVAGFRFDDLTHNEQFVSATLQATQAALRTHQAEKLDALRNAVLNIATGNAPSDDKQLVFLNLIDRFTPSHLQILAYLQDRAALSKPTMETDLSNQVMLDLNAAGLLQDGRAFTARNRDYPDLLMAPGGNWTVNSVGTQFLEFIKEPITNV